MQRSFHIQLVAPGSHRFPRGVLLLFPRWLLAVYHSLALSTQDWLPVVVPVRLAVASAAVIRLVKTTHAPAIAVPLPGSVRHRLVHAGTTAQAIVATVCATMED